MGDLAESILRNLSDEDALDSVALARRLGVDHQKVIGGVKSLQSLDDLVAVEPISAIQWVLTGEGESVRNAGSYEFLVFDAISNDAGVLLDDIMKRVPNAKIGFSKAMAAGWVRLDKKADGGARVFRKTTDVTDVVRQQLGLIESGLADQLPEKERNELKKRKLCCEQTIKSCVIRRGANFSTTITKSDTDLTSEMIAKGTWADKTFKEYNFNALGIPPDAGHFHPLLKVKSEFRQIFLEMGFTEMATNQYVENSFWNFDALFQPQDHPARDMQDTFFISDPAESSTFPNDYLERVRQAHTTGGYGSQGYQCDWKLAEAKKNVLRTHTTAVSARVLYKMAQQEHIGPVKLFSIDRVFRNESLDATHLAEFHQIEGVVGDWNLSMSHMIGIFTAFFSKLGLTELRFKPTYNPYTEPSMEIFNYHEGLDKWVEIGNSGLFRPEMLRPMGLPDGYRVAGWGLSLERPTMILYGIDNIRELCGHKINLQMVHDNPLCQFDERPPQLDKPQRLFDRHHDQP